MLNGAELRFPQQILVDTAQTTWHQTKKLLVLSADFEDHQSISISALQAISGEHLVTVTMHASDSVELLVRSIKDAVGYSPVVMNGLRFLRPCDTLATAGLHDGVSVSVMHEQYPDIHVEMTHSGIEEAKQKGNAMYAQGNCDEAARWFSKAMWLIETKQVDSVPTELSSILHSNRAWAYILSDQLQLAEEDCSMALQFDATNIKALYRRALSRFGLGSTEDALTDVSCLFPLLEKIGDPKTKEEMLLDLSRLRVRIRSSPTGEDFPDIDVELSVAGIDDAKNDANTLFSQGLFRNAARLFSKCIWLVRENRVVIPQSTLSILHSNRAFAYITLKRWSETEEDCCIALSLSAVNSKARYRRALSRVQLGQLQGALEDVEEVIQQWPDAADAQELKDSIIQMLA